MTTQEILQNVVDQINEFNEGKKYTKKDVLEALEFNIVIDAIHDQVLFLRTS